MSDIAMLEHKVGELENDVKDINKDIERLDGESGEQSDRILRVETWQKGNGARGAEARLQCVEEDIAVLKTKPTAALSADEVNTIAGAAALAIVGNARKRDKTGIERIKAVAAILNPILSAAALITAAIIAAVAAS